MRSAGGARFWVTLLTLVAPVGAGAVDYEENDIQGTEHVQAVRTKEAEAAVVALVTAVVDVAYTVYAGELKLQGPDPLKILVSSTGSYFPVTMTDRAERLFVSYMRFEGLRISRLHVPSDGPVAILCRATAELFNPHRVPGLEQYLAAEYAVEAVAEQLREQAWETPYPYRASEGKAAFHARCGQPALLRAHPQLAAAAGLRRVVDKLGIEWLREQLNGLAVDGPAALEALRTAATKADPGLAAAFGAWDEARRMDEGQDGAVLLTSFEKPADLGFFNFAYLTKVELSDEWATEGERSLRLTMAGGQRWPRACLVDSDWRYADWSDFAGLEFDARNAGSTAVTLLVTLTDEFNRGHGQFVGRYSLEPGNEQHCVLPVVPAPPHVITVSSLHYDGAPRYTEMAEIEFSLRETPAEGATILIDNLRRCR